METAYLDTNFYLLTIFYNPLLFLARLPLPVTRFKSIPIPAIDFSLVLFYFVVYSLSPVRFFWDPENCSPSGFSARGISQARILEWVAIPFSRASSWPRDWTRVSCIRSEFFTIEPWGKPSLVLVVEYIFLIWLCVLLQHLIFWCKLNSRGEKWGGMNWDIGVETYILPWIDNYWDNYMRTCCIARGTLLSALWWLKREENPKNWGNVYTCNWFTLL